MSDHEHEFILVEGDTVAARCPHCRNVLSHDDVDALLKAALGLGKENALAINQWMAEWAHIQTAIGYPMELGLALNKFADAFPELDDS